VHVYSQRRRNTATAVLVLVASLLLGATVFLARGAAAASSSQVTVPRGKPLQIAVVLDRSTATGATFTEGIRNAIQMAVEATPTIRGFPVQLNDLDGPCGSFDDVGAANVAAANAVVANSQNVAVIGHMCSEAFGAPGCLDASLLTPLAIYESHTIIAINGSATNSCLPGLGPTVFDRTIVADGPDADAWYNAVQALPSDVAWAQAYEVRFGKAPTLFADLYYDAASLLLRNLQQSSRIANGSLTIDRAALAAAVRNTVTYQGVTCTVTLDPATGNRVNDLGALGRCAG
jgi:ABC-type branched-subunit amino acid transport system substrate-binding protein